MDDLFGWFPILWIISPLEIIPPFLVISPLWLIPTLWIISPSSGWANHLSNFFCICLVFHLKSFGNYFLKAFLCCEHIQVECSFCSLLALMKSSEQCSKGSSKLRIELLSLRVSIFLGIKWFLPRLSLTSFILLWKLLRLICWPLFDEHSWQSPISRHCNDGHDWGCQLSWLSVSICPSIVFDGFIRSIDSSLMHAFTAFMLSISWFKCSAFLISWMISSLISLLISLLTKWIWPMHCNQITLI